MGPNKHTKYGVCNKNVPIKMLSSKHGLNSDKTLRLGMLVEVTRTFLNGQLEIKVYDYHNPDPVWEGGLYTCHKSYIIIIPNDVWLIMAAVLEPSERVSLAQDARLCEWISKLKVGTLISVTNSGITDDDMDFAMVRYKGMVPEIGPGIYFGLELLNNSYRPVSTEVSWFYDKYLNCEEDLALIVTANRLRPIHASRSASPTFSKSSYKQTPKDYAKQLLCGTANKADKQKPSTSSGFVTLNNQSSPILNRVSSHKTLPTQKRSKSIGTSKSLTIPRNKYNANEGHLVAFNRSPSPLRYAAPDPSMALEESTHQAQHTLVLTLSAKEMNRPKIQTSLSNPSIAETTISKVESRSIENIGTQNIEQPPQQYTSEYAIGEPNLHTANIRVAEAYRKPRVKSKSSNVISLNEKDMIFINSADEDTNTHTNAMLIENSDSSSLKTKPALHKHEVDLIELLGGDWPLAAGDHLAPILNTDMKTLPRKISNKTAVPNKVPVHSERNKSMNPLSHILSDRKTVTLDRKPKDVVPNKTDKRKNESFVTLSVVGLGQDDVPLIQDVPEYAQNTSSGGYFPGAVSPSLPPSPSIFSDLGVGSMVEVNTDISDPLYGVIRWIGKIQGTAGSSSTLAGIELEDDHPHLPLMLTDGTHLGRRLFQCPPEKALFVPLSQCHRDSRFQDIASQSTSAVEYDVPRKVQEDPARMFGQVDCPIVPGSVPPLNKTTDLESVCGKFRGIQGHHNSCYLDATLFAMFTFTGVFDSLLFRPPGPQDSEHYEEVQRVLREEIVNPLRHNLYVRADRVMKLRTLLEKLSSVTGLTCEEKDPEEFLNSLLAQILRADPFLKLSSGQEAFYYQLFVEKDERLSLPSVQQLFEQSFLASDIKLKEVPACLIIQMPRFGKAYKMYPRILPSQLLDVTDIIEDSPRQCTVCGKLAQFECRECFGQYGVGLGLESTAFCAPCLETAHTHAKRVNHKAKPLSIPLDFSIMAEHCPVPRLYMELFAVVCIETSHYVAFVKAGSGHEAPWCFFDSMADRKGERNGYNIPEMVSVPDLPIWLSDEGARALHEEAPNDRQLPEHAKRLLCDAYMCMYQSPDVMMYR